MDCDMKISEEVDNGVKLPTRQNEVLATLCSESGPKVASILNVSNQRMRSVVLCSLCGKIQTSGNYSTHLRRTHKLDNESVRVFTSRFKHRLNGRKQSRRGEDVKIYKCPNCPVFVKRINDHLRVCRGTRETVKLQSISNSDRDGPLISNISHTSREKPVFENVIRCGVCEEYQVSALYASHVRDVHNINDTGIHIFTSRFKFPRGNGRRCWKHVGIYKCPLRNTFTKNMERNRRRLHATGTQSTDK